MTTPHKPESLKKQSIPKATVELSPETSQKSDKHVEEEKEVKMEDTSDAKGRKKDILAKRGTVVRIPKPKDEKKQVFKKMLLLNMDTDN